MTSRRRQPRLSDELVPDLVFGASEVGLEQIDATRPRRQPFILEEVSGLSDLRTLQIPARELFSPVANQMKLTSKGARTALYNSGFICNVYEYIIFSYTTYSFANTASDHSANSPPLALHPCLLSFAAPSLPPASRCGQLDQQSAGPWFASLFLRTLCSQKLTLGMLFCDHYCLNFKS